MRKSKILFVGCLLATSILASTNSWAGDDISRYKISVTNLNPGQPIAPIMASSHHYGITFFKAGEAPTDELAMLAEAGNGKPMAARLLTMSGVTDAQVSTTGLTFPGKTTTMMIKADSDSDRISIGAMLGATNDAFFGISNVKLPTKGKSVTYEANVYDAGSETNDELSSTVAGLGGEGYSPNNTGEGFVTIHNGIHGIGDLVPSIHDWNNPAAKIVIERMGKAHK